AVTIRGDVVYVVTAGPVPKYGDQKVIGEPVYGVASFSVASDVTPLFSQSYPGQAASVAIEGRGILLATTVPLDPDQPYGALDDATDVHFLDISNTSGSIVLHGTARVNACLHDPAMETTSLVFDGRFARLAGCASAACAASDARILSSMDF